MSPAHTWAKEQLPVVRDHTQSWAWHNQHSSGDSVCDPLHGITHTGQRTRHHLGPSVYSFKQQAQGFQSASWIFPGLLNSFIDDPSSEEIRSGQDGGLHQLYIFLHGNLCRPRGKRASWITNLPISIPELPLIPSTPWNWIQNWGTSLPSAHSSDHNHSQLTQINPRGVFQHLCSQAAPVGLCLSKFLRFILKLKLTELSKDMPTFLAKLAMFTESEHFTCFYGKI